MLSTQRLDQVLDKNLPKGQFIDFMTIDTENHNLEVLRSNNWEKYRPTFIVVELDDIERNLESIHDLKWWLL